MESLNERINRLEKTVKELILVPLENEEYAKHFDSKISMKKNG